MDRRIAFVDDNTFKGILNDNYPITLEHPVKTYKVDTPNMFKEICIGLDFSENSCFIELFTCEAEISYVNKKSMISANQCYADQCYTTMRLYKRPSLFSRPGRIPDAVEFDSPQEGLTVGENEKCMPAWAFDRMLTRLAKTYDKHIKECVYVAMKDYKITNDIIKEYNL